MMPNATADNVEQSPLNNIDFTRVIIKGSSIVTLDLATLNIKMRDTHLILPGSLASLGVSLKCPAPPKGTFPFKMPQVRAETSGLIDMPPINVWCNGLPPFEFYTDNSTSVAKVCAHAHARSLSFIASHCRWRRSPRGIMPRTSGGARQVFIL